MKTLRPTGDDLEEVCAALRGVLGENVICRIGTSGPFALITLESPNPKDDDITVLFADHLVLQAGHFTSEAVFAPDSELADLVDLVSRMAATGYHARRRSIGVSSRLGPARSTARGVLTNARAWPSR